MSYGGEIPVRYNNEQVGIAMIMPNEILISVDKYETELKRAINSPGLSGFSLEIIGGK